MKSYRVTWEIDLHANSPRAAAEKALAIHRDPESIATVFGVRKSSNAESMDSVYVRVFPDDETIDLSKIRGGGKKRRDRRVFPSTGAVMTEAARAVQIKTKAMARVLIRNGAGHKLFEMDIHGVSVTVTTPLNAEIKVDPDESNNL